VKGKKQTGQGLVTTPLYLPFYPPLYLPLYPFGALLCVTELCVTQLRSARGGRHGNDADDAKRHLGVVRVRWTREGHSAETREGHRAETGEGHLSSDL